ncbi:unnamed protein product [Paramecium primaurelia]|uniref:EB1 C-terminal domain-containing protein n=1 Tax=Paramecium primaurelia TaxID=5886 RepID=A0A8S1PTX5_PARPR|nr:unnamed protein product [Paramecium primaurelia]
MRYIQQSQSIITFQQHSKNQFFCSNGTILKKQPSNQDILIQIKILKQEKDYYFQKIKDLDFFIENASQLAQEQMYKDIKDIFYYTAEKSVIVLPNGELEVQGLPPSSEEQSSSQQVMQQEIYL